MLGTAWLHTFCHSPPDTCRIIRRAELASKVISIAFGEQWGEEQYAEAIRLQDFVKASPDESIRLLTGSPVKSCVSASLLLDKFGELGQEALDNIPPLIPGKVQVATQLSDLLGVVNAADGSSFLIGQSGRKQLENLFESICAMNSFASDDWASRNNHCLGNTLASYSNFASQNDNP